MNDHQNSQPTVFMVDDDNEMHFYIRRVMKSIHLEVDSYTSPQEFLDKIQPNQSGCLLLDLRMPEMTGLELYERLKERKIQLPVIMFTSYGDVAAARQAMKSGVFDFLEKPFSKNFLIERVQQAIREDAHRREEQGKRQEILERLATLTPREHEVMMKLVQGKTSKMIARELDIGSAKTVDNHKTKIMLKMQVHSVVELVHLASFCGLLPPAIELISHVEKTTV
jgi:FixJ family two-component response regulator